MKNYFFSLLILFTFTNTLTAGHIVGGQMTYTCEGNDVYNITLTIYRDCQGGGADFDNPASITVYHGAEQTPFVTSLNVQLNEVPIEVVPDIGPCLNIPDGFCIEKGVYNFNLTLPNSTEPYHIVYQRCCRNSNIINIGIGDTNLGVGSTFTIEITPFAQTECNNSPVLDVNPPIIFCAGLPFSFTHSAHDPDGADELVYVLATPYDGGGPFGTPSIPGDPEACNGIIPNPDCPPPFTPVTFIGPEYTADSPLGINSTLNIDPQTGTISGETNNLGQFIFGINILEYRNGELISIVREDVQVLVGACDVDYVNYLEGFGVDINGVFEIELQGVPNTPLPFILPPVPVDSFPFVQDYFWVVDLNNGIIDTLYPGDQVVILPGVGCYMGTLYVNHGLDCADDLDLIIKVNDVTNVDDDLQNATQLNVYPNPFRNTTTIDYEYPPELNSVDLSVYNALGQLIQTTPLKDQSGKIQIGETLSSGIYFVQINSEGQILKSFKVLKR